MLHFIEFIWIQQDFAQELVKQAGCLSKYSFCKSDNGINYLLNQWSILLLWSENDYLLKINIKWKSTALNSSDTPELKWSLREALSNLSVLSYQEQLARNLMLPHVPWTTVWQSSSSKCIKDLVCSYFYAQKCRKNTPVRDEWTQTHWNMLSEKDAELCSLGSSGVLRPWHC